MAQQYGYRVKKFKYGKDSVSVKTRTPVIGILVVAMVLIFGSVVVLSMTSVWDDIVLYFNKDTEVRQLVDPVQGGGTIYRGTELSVFVAVKSSISDVEKLAEKYNFTAELHVSGTGQYVFTSTVDMSYEGVQASIKHIERESIVRAVRLTLIGKPLI